MVLVVHVALVVPASLHLALFLRMAPGMGFPKVLNGEARVVLEGVQRLVAEQFLDVRNAGGGPILALTYNLRADPGEAHKRSPSAQSPAPPHGGFRRATPLSTVAPCSRCFPIRSRLSRSEICPQRFMPMPEERVTALEPVPVRTSRR